MVHGAIREKFIKLCYNQNGYSIDKPEFMEVFFYEYTKAKKNSKLKSIKLLKNIFRSLIAYQNP